MRRRALVNIEVQRAQLQRRRRPQSLARGGHIDIYVPFYLSSVVAGGGVRNDRSGNREYREAVTSINKTLLAHVSPTKKNCELLLTVENAHDVQ